MVNYMKIRNENPHAGSPDYPQEVSQADVHVRRRDSEKLGVARAHLGRSSAQTARRSLTRSDRAHSRSTRASRVRIHAEEVAMGELSPIRDKTLEGRGQFATNDYAGRARTTGARAKSRSSRGEDLDNNELSKETSTRYRGGDFMGSSYRSPEKPRFASVLCSNTSSGNFRAGGGPSTSPKSFWDSDDEPRMHVTRDYSRRSRTTGARTTSGFLKDDSTGGEDLHSNELSKETSTRYRGGDFMKSYYRSPEKPRFASVLCSNTSSGNFRAGGGPSTSPESFWDSDDESVPSMHATKDDAGSTRTTGAARLPSGFLRDDSTGGKDLDSNELSKETSTDFPKFVDCSPAKPRFASVLRTNTSSGDSPRNFRAGFGGGPRTPRESYWDLDDENFPSMHVDENPYDEGFLCEHYGQSVACACPIWYSWEQKKYARRYWRRGRR